MLPRSGAQEGLPYSLSRWTDVPAAKWGWFRASLAKGEMVAFDQRTGVPSTWSLKPEDTMGLVFWTKDPTNLVEDRACLEAYKVQVHVTVTGWHEVEKGAPDLENACYKMWHTANAFGAENVIWRFSPVPLVRDVVDRFESIARAAEMAGLKGVYVSFLQENDLMPETRPAVERAKLLHDMAREAKSCGIHISLCNEDKLLAGEPHLHPSISSGICASPSYWKAPGKVVGPSEGCGCVMMVDPFTINETCTMGCQYCLDPSTPVLYSDMVWRPIGEARVGDSLVGFDEAPSLGAGVRRARRMRETIIEAVSISKQPTIRLITGQSEVFTTSNHGWINDRGKWLSTRTIWGHGPMRTKLRQIGQVKDLPFTDEYKLGYLAAMTLGDGTNRYQPGQRSDKKGFLQAYWRVALKDGDEAPLGRLVSYLASFGIEAFVRPFNARSAANPYLMSKVEVRALGKLQQVHDLLSKQPEHPDYWRGFLAGFYDAEGGMDGREGRNLRVAQKDRMVLRRVGDYARKFGFDLDVETHTDGKLVGTSRLRGSLRDRMRFISTIRPALSRKSPGWVGSAFEADDDPVLCKESTGARDVVDIQTSTHTFFAAGLATHNCYAADKNLSPKKRNTTRALPVLR